MVALLYGYSYMRMLRRSMWRHGGIVKDEYRKIKRIIDDYFQLIKKLMTGEGTVPDYVLHRLRMQGLKVKGLIPRIARYGASLFPDGDAKVRARELKKQIELAQLQAGLALDHVKTKMLETSRDALAGAAAAAAGVVLFTMIAQRLRERRREFESDWSRTAKTGMHDAKQQGSAAALVSYPNGEDTRVYKLCQPDACERCVKAYQNPDGTPKIFTVGELRRNGSNAGRKADQWLPVIGCMHPHCQCTLHLAP